MVEISTYLNKCPSSQFFWGGLFRDDLGSLLLCYTKTDAIIKTDEFRKSSKQHLTHPPPFLENHVAISFSNFMLKKPCLKVQICRIHFWIENDSPPPFGIFLKIHWFCWHHLFLCQKIVCGFINLNLEKNQQSWARRLFLGNLYEYHLFVNHVLDSPTWMLNE